MSEDKKIFSTNFFLPLTPQTFADKQEDLRSLREIISEICRHLRDLLERIAAITNPKSLQSPYISLKKSLTFESEN
jgi:hypothetical protein